MSLLDRFKTLGARLSLARNASDRWGPGHSVKLEGPFASTGDFLWWRQFPELLWNGDTLAAPDQSNVVLFENGIPLGPAHAHHAVIRAEGKGRYSHWGPDLFFSTSDNSDPNTNGRIYTLALLPKDARVSLLSTGSCHIYHPVIILAERHLARFSVPFFHGHYTEEFLQLFRYLQGDVIADSPELLRRMVYRETDEPLPREGLGQPDAALIEICNPHMISYRGGWLNRPGLSEMIRSCSARSKEEGVLGSNWFYNGLSKQNDEVTAGLAEDLLRVFSDSSTQGEVDRDIIRHARGVRQSKEDLRQGVLALRREVGAPLGMISHTLRYLPDGRPMSWPADFYRTINQICVEEGIPIFNPQTLVADLGPERSLEPDLTHHTRQFYEAMADRLVPMTEQLTGRTLSSPGAAGGDPPKHARAV